MSAFVDPTPLIEARRAAEVEPLRRERERLVRLRRTAYTVADRSRVEARIAAADRRIEEAERRLDALRGIAW